MMKPTRTDGKNRIYLSLVSSNRVEVNPGCGKIFKLHRRLIAAEADTIFYFFHNISVYISTETNARAVLNIKLTNYNTFWIYFNQLEFSS